MFNNVPNSSALPPDELQRNLAVARPDDDSTLPHIGVVGDTYTILLTGNDTGGGNCLIDMHIPPGGGPPPHRQDFEESFNILQGEIEVTYRGVKSVLHAGETANVSSNAPHPFQNKKDQRMRVLCTGSPAGMEELFVAVGVPVASRTTPPSKPDAASMAAFKEKSELFAPKLRTEFLKHA